MQGLADFIETDRKISYVNQLLKVGFHTLDFGSFVSPKAIPQMKDTSEVVEAIDFTSTKTRLLAIVANERGAQDALRYPQVNFLGFPLSLSETFQMRNTNQTVAEGFDKVRNIHGLTTNSNVKLVVYLSMGFGNPYGDEYSVDMISDFVEILASMGIEIVSLADTIGTSSIDLIETVYPPLLERFTELELGAHLHATPGDQLSKIKAVLESGCKRIDGAMLGYGGCPMAKDDLTGNVATENILKITGYDSAGIDEKEFKKARLMAREIFN